MRHGKKVNHLGRTASHRKAMLSNMASSLIKHKRIVTTVAKAKALRVYIEPLITKSKVTNTHNMRTVFSYLKDKDAVKELFGVVNEKVSARNGGYTRILKTGNRAGDNAEMALIELVDFNEYFDGFNKGAKQTAAKKTRRSKSTNKTTETAKPSNKVVTAAETTTQKEDNAIAENLETSASNQIESAVETDTVNSEKLADNLEDIDGIGPAFAQRLNALGIFSFEDLANLTDDKIAELEEKDSMTSIEEWHNWIEQAKSKI